MLFNPKWEKPSVAGFKTWLQRQNPNQRFCYGSCGVCAVAQYLASMGYDWDTTPEIRVRSEMNSYAWKAYILAHQRGVIPTFADVLDAIEEGPVLQRLFAEQLTPRQSRA